jgi:hypothetical protein
MVDTIKHSIASLERGNRTDTFFLDNERLLRHWSDTFGAPALQVRLYEKSVCAKTLLSQFLQMLGCQSPPRLVLPQRTALQKVSLPPDALEYLRLRNLHRAPSKGQHRITMTLPRSLWSS